MLGDDNNNINKKTICIPFVWILGDDNDNDNNNNNNNNPLKKKKPVAMPNNVNCVECFS